MDVKELTEAMHRFVAAKGWYQPDSLRPQTPRNIAISLVLEASEVLEHFQWSEDTRNAEELPGELADVALYLLQLASVTGIDLEQAIMDKLRKNYGRTWDEDLTGGSPPEGGPAR
jgi:NTP pyrophosphatase (non-canonical NTP hydrolase)